MKENDVHNSNPDRVRLKPWSTVPDTESSHEAINISSTIIDNIIEAKRR